MLEYSLHDNVLTARPNDMSAQTHPGTVYDREAFINLMLQRGTLVTKTDIVAVFTNMEETVAYIIENGGTINLPLFGTGFSISGVFEGAADSFDPERHKLNVTIRKGAILRNAEKQVKVLKVNAMSPQPQILEVKDSVSGAVDSHLSARGVIEISGINIKIVGDNPAIGLYFIAEDGLETRTITIITNKPSQVIALIPDLAPGMYKLRLATQYSSKTIVKEPKMTIYDKPLVYI